VRQRREDEIQRKQNDKKSTNQTHIDYNSFVLRNKRTGRSSSRRGSVSVHFSYTSNVIGLPFKVASASKKECATSLQWENVHLTKRSVLDALNAFGSLMPNGHGLRLVRFSRSCVSFRDVTSAPLTWIALSGFVACFEWATPYLLCTNEVCSID